MEEARTIALVGPLYQLQGKIQPAKEQYKKALTVFHRLSDSLNESATLYAIGLLELQQNDLPRAEEYLQNQSTSLKTFAEYLPAMI
jgi:Tfp pilus assembly protein PilF